MVENILARGSVKSGSKAAKLIREKLEISPNGAL